MLSERRQNQKATHNMIIVTWHSGKGKKEDRKQITDSQGQEFRKGVDYNQAEGSFCGWQRFWKLTMMVVKYIEYVHWKTLRTVQNKMILLYENYILINPIQKQWSIHWNSNKGIASNPFIKLEKNIKNQWNVSEKWEKKGKHKKGGNDKDVNQSLSQTDGNKIHYELKRDIIRDIVDIKENRTLKTTLGCIW